MAIGDLANLAATPGTGASGASGQSGQPHDGQARRSAKRTPVTQPRASQPVVYAVYASLCCFRPVFARNLRDKKAYASRASLPGRAGRAQVLDGPISDLLPCLAGGRRFAAYSQPHLTTLSIELCVKALSARLNLIPPAEPQHVQRAARSEHDRKRRNHVFPVSLFCLRSCLIFHPCSPARE